MSKNTLLKKCAIILMAGISCVQAKSPQDYFDVIRNFTPTPPMTEQPAETGYFGTLRNGLGNGMRSVGDWFRTEDNVKTDLGKFSNTVKEAGCYYASEQTGGWLSSSFFRKTLNPLGNALRSVGAQVRTTSETQTLARTLMDKANIHCLSSAFEVHTETSAMTKALAQRGDQSTFFDLLKGIAKRGHTVDQKALQEQYALEAAKTVMKENNNLSEDEAKSTLRIRLESFFEKAGLEFNKISDFVSRLFEKAKQILAAEKNRR